MNCKCKKCGHKWQSRIKKPAQCPRCKTYKWAEEKEARRVKEVASEG